jgi:hypothetical protein
MMLKTTVRSPKTTTTIVTRTKCHPLDSALEVLVLEETKGIPRATKDPRGKLSDH